MRELRTSSLYICTVLGAGFATGRELSAYFVKYGKCGFLGIIISSVLFGMTAYKILKSRYRENGDFVGKGIFNCITVIFFVVLYSAMISAGGQLFSELFNMPVFYGSFGVAALSFLSARWESMGDVSAILCPLMIIISIITALSVPSYDNVFKGEIDLAFVPSAFIYTAYNIITASAVLIAENNFKQSPLKVALLSGAAIGGVAIFLSIPLYLNYEIVQFKTLPLLNLVERESAVWFLYVFMLTCAIYTTALSNCFSAVKQTGLKPFSVTVIAFILSFIGFDKIVDKVYFIFGIAGLVILFRILKEKGVK